MVHTIAVSLKLFRVLFTKFDRLTVLYFHFLLEKVNKFKKQLEEEEMASRNIRKLPGY